MPEKIESYKVVCVGGLDTTENHLALSDDKPGSATRLINYEVSLFGGYRRINGFSKLHPLYSEVVDPSGTASEGKVLGLAIYRHPSTGIDTIIAARKDVGSATYSFFQFVAGVGWQRYTTPTLTSTNVTKVRHVVYNFGAGNQIAFADGVNPAIVFDGTNWNQITTGGSGTTGSYGGPQALSAPSVIDVFKNHLFISADSSNEAVVAYSSPNAAHDWTAASGAGQSNIGFKVVQFKPFRDNIFVFGSNSIKKIAPDITSGFKLDNVTNNVGCIAADSVLELGGDLVFLSPDGVRPVSGTSRIGDVEISSISKPIQRVLSNLPSQFDLSTLNGLVVRGKTQLRYFIGDSTKPVASSFGIIGGLRTSDQQLGWEFGELYGIRASCCTSGFVGAEEYVIHGDYDGRVYRQEQGNTFDGENILALYSTPYLDFGDTEVRKVFRKVNTFIRAEGPLTMNISLNYDWGDDNTPVPVSYDDQSSGAPVVYNDPNIEYGGTNVVYGGNTKPIFVTDIEGSGFAARTTFATLGNYAPHSIQGIVYEFSISGRN